MAPATLLTVDPVLPDEATLAPAAEALRAGGLVAFPTETVYGLGANALDPAAVTRLFAAKGRPADNPLIVHAPDAAAAWRVVAATTPLAERLAARFWPGPLTLVARGTHAAASSANRSGRPSPTTAAHVIDDLGARVDVIVDGGACAVGVESTVVDARADAPVVLREGAITREDLAAAGSGAHAPAGALDAAPGDAARSAATLGASPGTRHRHYAPACEITIAPAGDGPALAAALARGDRRVGLVARGPAPAGVVQVARFRDAGDLARGLYAALRGAEAAGLDVVVVEAVLETGLGRAVMDRLRRAARG